SIKTPGLPTGVVQVHVEGTGVHQAVSTEPASLDFGTVLIGTKKTLPMVVNNLVPADQHLDIWSDDPAFTIDPPTIDLAPHGASRVFVTFTPTSHGSFDGPHIRFLLCASCALQPVTVQGTGAAVSLAFAPEFIDFGRRSVGFRSCQTVSVKNDGDLTLSVD